MERNYINIAAYVEKGLPLPRLGDTLEVYFPFDSEPLTYYPVVSAINEMEITLTFYGDEENETIVYPWDDKALYLSEDD